MDFFRHAVVDETQVPAVKITNVIIPLVVTLRKYGLTAEAWRAIFHRQGGVCAVCKRLPESGRLNVDHDHAPGWKKMPPEERVLYVRGLLCYYCNKAYVGRGITVERAENVVVYLKQYASVRPVPVKKESRPKAASTAKKVRRTQAALVESSGPDSSSSDSSSKPASPLGFPLSESN